MAQQAQSVPLQITYGHTDEIVVMVLSKPTGQIGLKPTEVDAMIDSLEDMKVKLAAHRKAKGWQP